MEYIYRRILSINLSEPTYDFLTLPDDVYLKYLGGRGLSAYFLNELKLDDPFSDKNNLMFFPGLLCGSGSPSSDMINISAVSPVSGAFCDNSVGGMLGTMIKRAGLDGIIVSGISEDLLGLSVEGDKISFVKSENLRGKGNSEICSSVDSKFSIASSGSAGEDGILTSSIVIDNKFMTYSGGLGYVMASKGLKYIAVYGEAQNCAIDGADDAVQDVYRLINASPALMGRYGISAFGTAAFYDLADTRCMLPAYNFKKTKFGSSDKLNPPAIQKKYGLKSFGCGGCNIKCFKTTDDGRLVPEYDSFVYLSAVLGNDDADTVTEGCKICYELGLEPISACSAIASYCERRGLILDKTEILSMLRNMKGSEVFKEYFDSTKNSMTTKSIPISAFDPRGAYGTALGYAVSTSGGDWKRANAVSHEILRKPAATDRFSFSGKARIIKNSEDVNAVFDALGICRYISFGVSLEEYSKIFNIITGLKMSAGNLSAIGERIVYAERCINTVLGLTSADDVLPERFFNESGTGFGSLVMKPLDINDFEAEKRAYYKIRMLNDDGTADIEKASELGINA